MLKKWYREHKEWLSLFSSAFVGTLLGIGITFGISAYTERQHQEEIAHKYLVMTLNEIDKRHLTLEREMGTIHRRDSIFSEVLSYYPDYLDEIPLELVSAFSNELSSFSIFTINHMAENLFFNNIEVIETFDDLSVIADISNLFACTNQVAEIVANTEKIRNGLFSDYCKRVDFYSNNSASKFIRTFFQNPEVVSQIQHYSMFSRTLPYLLGEAQRWNENIKFSLGITDNDLRQMESQRMGLRKKQDTITVKK